MCGGGFSGGNRGKRGERGGDRGEQGGPGKANAKEELRAYRGGVNTPCSP